LFAVFDGHGSKGAEAAAFAKSNFLQHFPAHHLPLFVSDAHAFLSSVFIAIHDALCASAIDTFISGTTLSVAIVCKEERKLVVANVGDCRIVLGRLIHRVLKPMELTKDHTCFEPLELERVLRSGARVQQDGSSLDGPLRIYKGSLPYPGIVVTRTLGDDAARRLGVTPQPEVHIYPLHPACDMFFILATDGVWDGLTNLQVCQIVARTLDKPTQRASEELTRASLEALEKERVDDNTTNIVVVLRWNDGKGYDSSAVGRVVRKRRGTWSSYTEGMDD